MAARPARNGRIWRAPRAQLMPTLNGCACRIEMPLVSTRRQPVRVRALGLTLPLRRGERIRTEVSCKYTRRSLARLLGRAG